MDTFVLRIWTPATDAGHAAAMPAGTHGTAHHVATGRSGIFRTSEQLLEVLADLRKTPAGDPTMSDDDGSTDGPVTTTNHHDTEEPQRDHAIDE